MAPLLHEVDSQQAVEVQVQPRPKGLCGLHRLSRSAKPSQPQREDRDDLPADLRQLQFHRSLFSRLRRCLRLLLKLPTIAEQPC